MQTILKQRSVTMMRRAILVLALLAGACRPEAEARPQRLDDEAYQPQVVLEGGRSTTVRIIDGDTVELDGETVRISNIDAPELPPRSKCWAEAALSIQASEVLTGSFSRTGRLRIVREGKDRYGRTLARLYDGERDIGQSLVNLGLAARWTGRRWDWCGPADLKDPNGPAFFVGPDGNPNYSDWIVERETSTR